MKSFEHELKLPEKISLTSNIDKLAKTIRLVLQYGQFLRLMFNVH